MNAKVYGAIVEAERAAHRAHNLAYECNASLWVRWCLGRAQSILMSMVVRYAGRYP